MIDWQVKPTQICDYSQPPFAPWFAGGKTNLCHNALDRHLRERAGQAALIYVSTETGVEATYSFAQLSEEVQRMAATFGVAYITRPVGAFILNHVDDRYGRKRVLTFTLLLMGVSTFLVGLLTTYWDIGVGVPILLV